MANPGMSDVSRRMNEALNSVIANSPELRSLFPSSPNYHYWETGTWRYCYSTQRADKGKFWGMIYHLVKNKKTWYLRHKRGFNQRHKAKDWAYKLYCQRTGQEFHSLRGT